MDVRAVRLEVFLRHGAKLEFFSVRKDIEDLEGKQLRGHPLGSGARTQVRTGSAAWTTPIICSNVAISTA